LIYLKETVGRSLPWYESIEKQFDENFYFAHPYCSGKTVN